jgi:hypothetical protein
MSLRFSRNPGPQAEALGRSRGGLGSKIVGVCDAAGRLVDFLLMPGQAHELAPSLTLLRRLPEGSPWCPRAGVQSNRSLVLPISTATAI